MIGKVIFEIAVDPEMFCECYHITKNENGDLLTNGVPITPEWLKTVILQNHSKVYLSDNQVKTTMMQLDECIDGRGDC